MRIEVQILIGSAAQERRDLTGERILIGRGDKADLCFPLPERTISHRHAEVYAVDGVFFLEDAGSANGTYLNGKRIQRAEIRVGDSVQVGPTGAGFRVIALGFDPATTASGEDGSERRYGSQTVKRMIASAILKAGGGGTGEAAQIHRQIKLLERSAGRGIRILGTLLALVSLLLVGSLVWFYLREQEREKALDRMLAAATDAARRQMAEQEDLFSRRLGEQEAAQEERRRNLRSEIDRLRQELGEEHRRAETNQARVKDLDQQIQTLATDLDENLAQGNRFKAIQKGNDQALVFIYTALTLVKDGQEEEVKGAFGTGFFVTEEGHIVTNKHVVQPWKFDKLARRIAEEGWTVDHERTLIAAWSPGMRVLDEYGGLDLRDGYNNRHLKNLRVLRGAEDHWQQGDLGAGPDGKVRRYSFHHPADNNDLALLKVDGLKVRPVKLRALHDPPPEKLDTVMVLGFPRGMSILEKGRVESSPSLGTVRKVEETIYVTASIIPGNSGGPVFNATGEVVGVSTRVVEGTETLGICLRTQHIHALLRQ